MDKHEKELRQLAKEMVWCQTDLEKDSLYEWEREEVKEEVEVIRKKVLDKGYDINIFLQYMEEYRNMTIEDYIKKYKDR